MGRVTDVSSVTDMSRMFAWATTWPFDSDISKWDVSSVTDMTCMFAWAPVFDAESGHLIVSLTLWPRTDAAHSATIILNIYLIN